MNASELADKLEKHEPNGHMETFNALMFLYRDTILKCLRFAADIEKLVSEGEDPVFIQVHKNLIWIDGVNGAEQGTDIYSAARKAVEAVAFNREQGNEMNLEDRIEMAIKPEIEVWHSEHDPSMYRQKHEMAGQLIEFQDGFEKGYRAAMRSLYAEVNPEDRRYRAVYDCELRNGNWARLMHFSVGDTYWDCDKENSVPYDDVLRTVRLTVIPCPAEIFGKVNNDRE